MGCYLCDCCCVKRQRRRLAQRQQQPIVESTQVEAPSQVFMYVDAGHAPPGAQQQQQQQGRQDREAHPPEDAYQSIPEPVKPHADDPFGSGGGVAGAALDETAWPAKRSTVRLVQFFITFLALGTAGLTIWALTEVSRGLANAGWDTVRSSPRAGVVGRVGWCGGTQQQRREQRQQPVVRVSSHGPGAGAGAGAVAQVDDVSEYITTVGTGVDSVLRNASFLVNDLSSVQRVANNTLQLAGNVTFKVEVRSMGSRRGKGRPEPPSDCRGARTHLRGWWWRPRVPPCPGAGRLAGLTHNVPRRPHGRQLGRRRQPAGVTREVPIQHRHKATCATDHPTRCHCMPGVPLAWPQNFTSAVTVLLAGLPTLPQAVSALANASRQVGAQGASQVTGANTTLAALAAQLDAMPQAQ